MNPNKAAAADAKNATWLSAAKAQGYVVSTTVSHHRSGLFRVTAVATREHDAGYVGRYLASFRTAAQAAAYGREMENA